MFMDSYLHGNDEPKRNGPWNKECKTKKGRGFRLALFTGAHTGDYFLLTSSKSASTTSSWPLGRGPSWGPASGPGPAAPF